MSKAIALGIILKVAITIMSMKPITKSGRRGGRLLSSLAVSSLLKIPKMKITGAINATRASLTTVAVASNVPPPAIPAAATACATS